MKTRQILVLVNVLVLGFGAGLLYQQHRDALKLADPQQALRRSTAQLVKAAEELQRTKTSTGTIPSRLDEALLALHDIAKGENSSAVYNFTIYHKYRGIWSERRKRSPAPVLLEIGPGSNMGQGVIFAMTGAKKYYGLDIYRDPQFYNRRPYQAVAALLSTVAPESIISNVDSVFRIDDDKVVFNREKVEFLYPHQSYNIPLPPMSVDYVFSHSVFEHISDPEATINSILRLLPSGGLTAHHFDLRDHHDFSKPLEFLKLDTQTFKKRDEKLPYSTNRWRLSDFVAAFKKSGYRIHNVEVTSRLAVTEETRRSLHPDFQRYSIEDLSAMSAIIIAEKP
jgi:SAM-dependent methyltransferase